MEPVPGLRARLVGARVRRLRARSRPGDAEADPVARGHGARAVRRRVGRRVAGSAVAAPGVARAARARAGARLRREGRLGARVLFAAGDLRAGAQPALPRPDAVRPVHPRLPHPRLDLFGAAAAADPQRDARRGHARRDLEGRGVARPAGDQLPVRRRADDGRQPRRLQERREGDRASERLLDHVHGEARPHVDRELVPHPLVALARRGERVRGRERRLPAVPRGADRVRPRAGGLLRAEHQLVQAVRGRLVGADDARVGSRQPHVRLPGGRARGRRCGSRRGSPAATSIRISRSRR